MSKRMYGVLLVTTLIILSPWVLTGCNGSTGMTAEENISKAKDFYDRQELEAAIIELKNALLKAPDNPEARRLLGLIHLETGDAASAEKELQRAMGAGVAMQAVAVPLAEATLMQGNFNDLVAETPDESGLSNMDAAELWAIQGDAYVGLKQVAEADKAYDRALALQSDAPRAVTGKARLAASSGDVEEALRLLEQVHEGYPDFKSAWSLQGDIERVRGNAQAAEAAYSKAIEPHKKADIDLMNRALVRIYLGDLDGASNDIATINQQAPGHPMVAYVTGVLEFKHKNYAEAQEKLENVVRNLPDFSPAEYYLALTHFMQNHLQQAEQYGSYYVAHNPLSDQGIKLLAATKVRLGDLEGAESILQSVLRRNPDDTYALRLMGEVEMGKGQTDKSIEYFQKVVSLDPESPDAYMKMGISYLSQGESRKGVEAIEEAARLNPEYQDADAFIILGYFKAAEYQEALAAAERMQDKYPDSPVPFTLMAGVYLAQGDEAAGREMLQKALGKDPGYRNAAQNLARLELRSGAPEKARALYEQVLDHQPGEVSSLMALADLDLAGGDLENATQHLEQAIRANPDDLAPRLQLGTIYQKSGQAAKCLELLRGLPENQTLLPPVLVLRGMAQLDLQESTNAALAFEQLVRTSPELARAHYLLAKAYAQMGKLGPTRAALEKSLELDPDLFEAKLAMARLLMEENKPEEANKVQRELAEGYPDNVQVTTLGGWLAMRQGRPREAADAFRETLKKQPSSEVTVYLATSLWLQRKPEAAITTLKDWLDDHPADLAVQYHLANSYLLLDRLDEAQSAFARVIELAPEHALALNNLAWLMRKEDPVMALKYAEKANNLIPDSPLVMDTLGSLLLEQGETRRAVRLLQEASKTMPGNLDIHYRYATALVKNGEKAEAQKILNQILGSDQQFKHRKDAENLLQSLQG